MSTEAEKKKISEAVHIWQLRMQEKMHFKVDKGYLNWDDLTHLHDLYAAIATKTEQLCAGDISQAIDVANLAMMIDHIETTLLIDAADRKVKLIVSVDMAAENGDRTGVDGRMMLPPELRLTDDEIRSGDYQ